VRASVLQVAVGVEGLDLDAEGATGGLVAERTRRGVGDAAVTERCRVEAEAGRDAARSGAVGATVVDDLDQGAGAGLGQGKRVAGEDAVGDGVVLYAAGRAGLVSFPTRRSSDLVRASVLQVAVGVEGLDLDAEGATGGLVAE